MDVTRRQLVALGAAGAAGAVLGKVATSTEPAGAEERIGGIHIYAPTKVVSPKGPPAEGFPHTFALTVWGPDHALNGMGWGATVDGDANQQFAGLHIFQCFFTAQGAVKDGVVKLRGIMLFSGDPEDQGMPLEFEANLTTGFVRVVDSNAGAPPFVLEGDGVVARI